MLRLIWTSQVIFHHKIYLVKFVMDVAMFKNGAQDKGHWEWEMVTHQHSWTQEKDAGFGLIVCTCLAIPS
jgi:hypothetical protein